MIESGKEIMKRIPPPSHPAILLFILMRFFEGYIGDRRRMLLEQLTRFRGELTEHLGGHGKTVGFQHGRSVDRITEDIELFVRLCAHMGATDRIEMQLVNGLGRGILPGPPGITGLFGGPQS